MRSLVTTGVGDAVTSRPATLSQFAEGSPARRLIEALLDSRTRLLTADRSEANAEIRIAHEALIEYWPRAKRQIATDRRDIETRARLEALLRRYEEAPDTEKHRALLQALNLEEGLDLTRRWGIPAETPLGAFISASDAAHKAAVAAEVESAKRRSRRFLAGAAVLVVIFAGIAALVGWQSLRLTRERDAARLAQSRVVAAIADKVANEGDYGSALALALEALAGHERRNAALYPSEAERALDNAVRNLRETRVLRHGQENVLKVALSPDGRRIATASRDGTARIWDRGTGSEILHLNAHRSEIDALAFSADGCCVVTGSSKDTTARVWNPDTGAEISRFDIAPNDRSTLWFSQGSSFALTADAQRIAGVSTSGTARVWEVATGRMVNTFPIEKNSVPISFSSDGRRLLTASERRARIYDIDSGETRASFSADDFTYPIHSGGFSSNDRYVVLSAFGVSGIWDAATGEELEDRRSGPFLAFSADGRNYAVSKDNTARLIQLEDGKELAVSHPEPSYRVNFARFSPTGNKILTVHADFSVHMWAAASGARDTILKGHEGRITDAAFSPDEKSIITVSDDSTAREWDIAKQASITLRDSNLEPHIRFFPDGRSLLTAEENEAAIRDAETGKKVRTFRGHEAPIVDAALSADGRRVATASFDDTVRIWDAQTAEVIAVLGHDQKIRRLALSPDGRRILTDSFSDRIVRIWDAETGNEVARLATDRVTYEMAFSRDGHLVQTNGEKGVHFWDASTGNEVKLVHDRENRYQRVAFSPIDDKFAGLRNEGLEVRSIASGDLISKIDVVGASMRHFDFSPDGKLVVAGLQDKTARAWSASTGRPVLTLMGHDDGVTHAAVSPDGKLIVTSSRDRTVRVWDAETQTEIAILRGPDNADESKFSLSGRLVVSISNNLVQVWRVFGSVQELINQACKIAPRFLSSKQRGSFAVNVSSVGTACQK